jgi:heptosyltransferase-3
MANWARCQASTSLIDVFGLKILVLRGGALGDLILTLPVLAEIRESYPNAEVVLLGILPQARLAAPGFVDRVERIDAPDLLPIFVEGWLPDVVRNRLQGFDLAINLFCDPGSVIARNLAAAGVKRVLAGSSQMRPGVHAVLQLADVLGPLGLTLRDPVPRLAVGPKPGKSNTFAFHVGSGSAQKNWPIDHWTELTQQLDGFFDDFLLVGGEADDQVVREFRARCRIPRLRTLLNASLTDVCQALNECAVFVGHDTGVTHLAAAVGIPTIALFGPTNPNIWAPLGEHVSVLQSPDGLMSSISPTETAVETVRRTGRSADRRSA